MCMTITKKYTGKGKRVVVAYKVFRRPLFGRQGLLSQYGWFTFPRRQWSRSRRLPGFHAYKLRKDARRAAWCSERTVRKVRLKGLLGSSRTHYTARYLWVN